MMQVREYKMLELAKMLDNGNLRDYCDGVDGYLVVARVAWFGEVSTLVHVEFRYESVEAAQEIAEKLNKDSLDFMREGMMHQAVEREVWHVVSDDARDSEVA